MLAYPDGEVRYFTVRECAARLQTFPDSYVFMGPWTRCMRQLGNAVPVLLAEVVAKAVQAKLRLFYAHARRRQRWVSTRESPRQRPIASFVAFRSSRARIVCPATFPTSTSNQTLAYFPCLAKSTSPNGSAWPN